MASVTVVIPSYNCAEYISNALHSIIAQTTPDWQVVIIDDGSCDDTAAVVRPFLDDSRIRYLYQENRGLPAARNAGAKLLGPNTLLFSMRTTHCERMLWP